MSDKQLRLQVVFAALDKLTAPLKKIRGESMATGKAMQAVNDRLNGLNGRLKEVGYLRKLQQDFRATTVDLKKHKLALYDARDAYEDQRVAQQKLASQTRAARTEFKGLQRELIRTKDPSAQLNASFVLARENLTKLEYKYSGSKSRLRKLQTTLKEADGDVKKLSTSKLKLAETLNVTRQRLDAAGISTAGLRQHERTLRTDIAATNTQLAEQQKRLSAITAQNQKIAGARQHADKLRSTAGNVAAAGIGAAVAGGVIGAPIVKGLQESKHYQTEVGRVHALGLGKSVSDEAVGFAKQMKTYGTSQLDNLTLMRDGMTAFADVHHAEMVAPTLAKMKFGNHAFYGEEAGADNESKFMDMLKVIELRGGLASQEKFEEQANMVQKVITATGGRVGPSEWLNLIKTGGIAAKGTADTAFYYQMEPLVQEMGGHRVGTSMMSAYNNLYQGRTSKRAALNLDQLGLIGDRTKVRHDKVGQTAQLNPGALLGSDLFQQNQFEWMETVLLPQLAKKGITDKKQVLDTIGSLFSNRTAGDLFANMYLQREQIHKNAQLNAGAYDINQINTLGQGTANGKELEVNAKLADLKLAMGEKILPLYARAIETVTKALEGLNAFMEKNPTVAKVMIVGFGVLAGILVVLGPLMLGLAALIGPYAMLHVLFAKMGVVGGVLTPILRGLGGGFMKLGKTVLWLSRALLTNPIVLLITAIAVLAFLIYKNWEPIKAFFSDLWDGITERFNRVWESIKSFASGLWDDVKTAFDGGIGGVSALILNWSPLGLFYKAFAGVMGWFGIELPETFTEFGANIIQGLTNGISSGFGFLKDKIKQLASAVGITFAKEQEIHSPSRVFSRFGGSITEGLALGIENGQDAPLNQVGGLAKRLTQLGAGIAISAAAMPAMAFDTRPPLAPRAAGSSSPVQGDTIQIIIQPAAGMDAQAIARAVAQELDKRDRQKAARRRSGLSDHHD